MKTYIMMNKSKTRVRIENDLLYSALSGEVGYIAEFKPILYKGTFLDKVKALFEGYVLVEVYYDVVWEDFPECIHSNYGWVYNKTTGVVTKVYSPFSKERLTASGFSPFHFHNGNYTTFRFY